MYNYSIIIPYYTSDGSHILLNRILDSVDNREDIEIIVADNSPKPLEDKLFQYRKNLQIIYTDNSRGAGGARNEALKLAKGRWLLFADSDDFFTKEAFSIIDDYINSTVDVVFFNVTSCYSDNLLKKAGRHIFINELIDKYQQTRTEYEIRSSYPVPWGKLISAEFVHSNNIFFEEVPFGNDVIFSLKVGIKAKDIAVDKRVVYCVTYRENSLTTNITIDNVECRFRVCMRRNKIARRADIKISRQSSLEYLTTSKRLGIKPCFRMLYLGLQTGEIFLWLVELSIFVFKKLFMYTEKIRFTN